MIKAFAIAAVAVFIAITSANVAQANGYYSNCGGFKTTHSYTNYDHSSPVYPINHSYTGY